MLKLPTHYTCEVLSFSEVQCKSGRLRWCWECQTQPKLVASIVAFFIKEYVLKTYGLLQDHYTNVLHWKGQRPRLAQHLCWSCHPDLFTFSTSSKNTGWKTGRYGNTYISNWSFCLHNVDDEVCCCNSHSDGWCYCDICSRVPDAINWKPSSLQHAWSAAWSSTSSLKWLLHMWSQLSSAPASAWGWWTRFLKLEFEADEQEQLLNKSCMFSCELWVNASTLANATSSAHLVQTLQPCLYCVYHPMAPWWWSSDRAWICPRTHRQICLESHFNPVALFSSYTCMHDHLPSWFVMRWPSVRHAQGAGLIEEGIMYQLLLLRVQFCLW